MQCYIPSVLALEDARWDDHGFEAGAGEATEVDSFADSNSSP